MLSDTVLLDKIVHEAILDLVVGRELKDVSDWAIDAYVTRYGNEEKIASDYEIQGEFIKALVAELIRRERAMGGH